MYPAFDMANLSKYRREFLEGAQASTGGRSSKVFSGKTRVNIGGSDSESFYWSDVPGTNRPHQVRPQVQGSGDGVMLWGGISGDGPGYSTAIIDGTSDSNEYVEILKTSLMQALEYYGKQVKVFVFSKAGYRVRSN
ncbi:hypothetical protein INT46_011483 [Mucor plumbeus]|uniref:Uncharacterized protein n=1 Tax=Mucor plumbeus TaxID=97098 RepID=A0A8H7RMM5_9FUNG|nr:hypothetical protein INT46_011483 [Mucor plumbeus]